MTTLFHPVVTWWGACIDGNRVICPFRAGSDLNYLPLADIKRMKKEAAMFFPLQTDSKANWLITASLFATKWYKIFWNTVWNNFWKAFPVSNLRVQHHKKKYDIHLWKWIFLKKELYNFKSRDNNVIFFPIIKDERVELKRKLLNKKVHNKQLTVRKTCKYHKLEIVYDIGKLVHSIFTWYNTIVFDAKYCTIACCTSASTLTYCTIATYSKYKIAWCKKYCLITCCINFCIIISSIKYWSFACCLKYCSITCCTKYCTIASHQDKKKNCN